MKCPRCKKQLRKGAKFCPACGTRIEKKQKIRFTHILLIISILLGIIAIGWGGGILLAKISSTGTIKLDSKTIREAKIKVEDVTNIMDAAIDTYTDNEGYISIDAQNVALESISAQAEALFDSGKITDYSYNAGDSGIYFEIDNWLSVLYVPPIKDFMSNGDDTIEVVTLEPCAASWYLNYATSGFKGPDEAATCIIENISNFSFTQDLEDYEVSIETFVNLPKNAIVIFNGHGGCNSRIGSVLFTGVNAWDEDAMNQYSDAIANQAIGINQEGKFYLTSRFFDNYVADNAYSGNLFYLGSCSSCADPRLAQSLWDKGARAIIGNSNTVWVNYNFQMTYSFFEGLTTKDDSGQYLPVTKALEYAKNKHGAQDSFGYGSEVLACYRDDFTLVDMIDAKKYEDALVVKVTDPPVSDVYETYISATKNTIKDGSWSEHLVMTANMAITDGSAKTKTKVTLTSDADVSNYSESDPSQIRMSGSAEMTVMGQTYAWDMDYENGTAHYRYTKPNQTSADMKIDPSFFNFGTMTSDMMTNAKLSGNKITFTVPSEKIAEVGIAAVNQMSGVDDLEYGDVDVTVTISNEGKIDNIVMIFHASLEYQGYDADVDYNIDYRFSDSSEKSDKPASSDMHNLQDYIDFSKSWGIRKDVSTDPNLYMEQVYDFAFMEDGTFYCYFYQQYTDFIYGFHGTYLFEDHQIKFYFDNDDGTSTLYAYSFDPDAMKLTQVSEKGIWGTSVGTEYSLDNDEWFPSAKDVIDSAKRSIENRRVEMGG